MTVAQLPRGIVRVSRRPEASTVLIVLPHAGAGASACHKVAAAIESAEVWAVQLPGRESRLTEPVYTEMRAAAAALGADLAPCLDRPYGVYGHSLGAVLGFELCLDLTDRALLPEFFFPAASRAPAAWQWPDGLTADLAADDLLSYAQRLGGTPEEVLQNEQFREIVLHSLRADLALGSVYRPDPADRLSCPVTAFYGTSDPAIQEDVIRHWAAATAGPFRLRAIHGGHLFLIEAAAALGAAIQESIGR
jgi:pyochelin biosynthesis protein PchC